MIDNVKAHLQEHKTAYLVGGTLIVGVTIGIALARKPAVYMAEGDIFANKAPVTKTVVTFIENSTPSKPVHLVGTNLYFNSLNEAARKTGHSLSRISKNVNGHIPDVNGDVFELLEHA